MIRKIKTFENFSYPEQNKNFENDSWSESESWNETTEYCSNCNCACDDCECNACDCSSDWKESDDSQFNEKKSVSYKKSGLKNPEKADLNKDKKISKYEKTRGKAIQKSMQDKKEEKAPKGLTVAQNKLPDAIKKAILKNMKKK